MKILNIDFANESDVQNLKRIFFESSSVKKFASKAEKDAFIYKYFDYYRIVHSSLFFYICDDTNVYGYICGVEDSKSFSHLDEVFPYYKNLNEEKLLEYPAHLHINLSKDSRGKGLGKDLVEHFCNQLYTKKVRGVHIFTGVNSRNQSFYRRSGFCDELSVEYNTTFVHFMGRKIYSI